MNSFYHSSSSGEDNEVEEFKISGRGLNEGSDSDIDDSGAEEYEMAGQGLNDFKKSERLMPLSMRRRKGILKDYAQLRFYLRKKKDKKMDAIDTSVDSILQGDPKAKFKWKDIKSSGSAFKDGNPDLIHPADLTTGATRKAQPL